MTRTLLLCTVLLAGCDPLFGAVRERQPCAGHADCPAGLYCAPTSGGGVCWEDPVPPTVGSLTVTCSTTPCQRDATLTVEAAVADAAALDGAVASLDLDGHALQVAMAPVGGGLWRARLDLSLWPLAGATGVATARVTATDGARNVGRATAAAGQPVTRLRPAVVLDAGAVVVPTAPALRADGAVVVGGSTGRLYTVLDGAVTVSAASVGAAIVYPPVLGRGAIWVAANSRLFALALDGSGILNGTGYPTDVTGSGSVVGPAAITAGDPEVAFAAWSGGRMAAVRADAVLSGFIDLTRIIEPFSSGPSLHDDLTISATTVSGAPAATVRRFTFDGALGEGVARTIGQSALVPLALAADGAVWTGSAELGSSKLQETTAAGGAGASASLGNNAGGSPIVLSNGDVAICAGDKLHRFTAAGATAWSLTLPAGDACLSPLALARGPAALLVPSQLGKVYAVGAAGAILWSTSLSAYALRDGTVRADPAARTSVAWFTSADGLLHGLVVDGALDAAAPWPKAWHDARNTGNLTSPH